MITRSFCKTFITSVFILGAALFLTGCSNFLKGANTAEQLRAAISYANATPYLIKVLPEKGTGNVVKPASGEAHKKVTDTFEIKFETSSEYEFIAWQISSKKLTEAQNINNYITIEDPTKSETTVSFIKELEDIIITPIVARRPKLLSKTPVKSGSLSLKDTKIQVIFDKKMDPSSIYYTKEEITELKKELHLEDKDFLPENAVIGTTNIYGYKKKTDKGQEYIYKNILIKNNDTQENINDRFEAPYFETPTTLIIAPHRAKLPDGYTYISVSLDKSFCYDVEYENGSKKIGLYESQDWVYQVNNSIDNVPPKMTSCSIKYKDSSVSILLPSEENLNQYAFWSTNATMLETNDKKINIDFSAGDEGSGLTSYFDIELCRFIDEKYYKCANNTVTTLKKDYTTVGTVSTYKGTLDLSDYPEGIYSMKFVLYDNNGTKSYWPKVSTGINEEVDGGGYFVLDDGVHMDALSIDYYPNQSSSTDLLLIWGTPAKDLSEIDIKWKYPNSSTWTNLTTITDIFPSSGDPVRNQRVTGLNYAKQYDFKITYTDAKGYTQTVEKSSYTRPEPGTWIPFTYGSPYGTYSYRNNHYAKHIECKVKLPEVFENAYIVVSKNMNFSNSDYYKLTLKDDNGNYTLKDDKGNYFISLWDSTEELKTERDFYCSTIVGASKNSPAYLKVLVQFNDRNTSSSKIFKYVGDQSDDEWIDNPNY